MPPISFRLPLADADTADTADADADPAWEVSLTCHQTPVNFRLLAAAIKNQLSQSSH